MQVYKILCELMIDIDYMLKLFYSQNYFEGNRLSGEIIKMLTKLLSELGDCTFSRMIGERLPYLLEYQENNDYIGMADFYIMYLKPACRDFIEELRADGIWQEVRDFYDSNYEAADEEIRKMLCGIDAKMEDIPDGYEMIETSVGSFTLQVKADDNKMLLSSSCNPYDEAEILAQEYCEKGKNSYVVLGLGMGYLMAELSRHPDILDIVVCEHDLYVIKAVFHYVDLKEILKKGRVHIYYDPDLSIFSKSIAENRDMGIIIHRPSMMNIKDLEIRQKVQDFFIHDNSVRSQGKKLLRNFYMNTSESALESVRSAKELRSVFEGHDVLFIAAGPSLEENIPYLKELSQKYIVVAVGTVLKRLIRLGIKPDYVVMIDAQHNMMNQISGVDTSELSLIYLPTLYYEVLNIWEGTKYMALQKGFEQSEVMAQKNNDILFETGGSVSTLALDIAIRFLSRRIICIGLDLAYVDNKFHVGEKAFNDDVAGQLRLVKSVDGKEIYTAVNLDNYRLWIERRIERRSEQEKQVELINASGGAFIKGMINKKPDWKDGLYQ